MNILLNVRWPVGGIRTYLRYVYRHFPPEHYRFTLLAPPVQELEVIREDLDGHLDEIIVCTPTVARITIRLNQLLRSRQFDVVHSHGLSAGLLAAMPMAVTKVPHVVTLHDVFLSNLFAGTKGRLKHWVINKGLATPDVLHLLGDDQRKNLIEFFPIVARRPQGIEIVKSGIETERFSVEKKRSGVNELRKENDIADGTPLLGFFGRFMAQKGFATLVDAIEILQSEMDRSMVPVVVAFGSGGYLAREKRILESRNLIGQFRFLPFMPNIADALGQLDGVVMPSRWEAVGLVAMEVLVAGVPLLASDCIGLREVVNGTPAFSFRSGNARSLASALRDWSAEPRKANFRNFSTMAAKRFDVRNTAKGLQDLYARITGMSERDRNEVAK